MEALEALMSSNQLRLNSAKTQLICLGTRQQLTRLGIAALSVAFSHLTFSPTVRELGCFFVSPGMQDIRNKLNC